ncbi:MAG TPA: CoA pyrophosphatase [Bacteroidales bacterium]|nr:CoA pyrophosphatase [Bacteroidales bacterium]HPS16551.1 CoA pyrophosphatase [Bacteroidales bacterium]
MESLILKLEEKLKQPLPGESAQLLMGSDIRVKEFMLLAENCNTKHSGVLILLYPYENSIYSVLMQRPKFKSKHPGQMSLPGGKRESEDADIIQTALRETEEEIGVNRDDIHVMGTLTRLYIPPSNFVIYPTVGYVSKRPDFFPSPYEVDELIEYDIMTLLDPAIRKEKRMKVMKIISFKAPYFDIKDKVVWGATAMIISEFKEILKAVVN